MRLIGVRFSHMIPITMQMSLFENNVEKLGLYKAVDTIKNQYGSKVISKAITINLPNETNRDSKPVNRKKSAD